MKLNKALDAVYGHSDWHNPLRPYSVSSVYQTPYEAYQKLKPGYQKVVRNLIGHEPTKGECIDE